MIKRALTGLAAAIISTAACGALAAPAATAATDGGPGKPKTVCVWIWSGGPPQCKKLE
ncbi:hypothetical protein M8542_22990 [Amycolatopsis sp. OK19-0408]|uniref:Uncharacterized protein n=1 Tax=Amycolatopsis iheyensis TaxID=2945988 RepID=A0A9X2SML4_9PSEU|nr:hypothetical protein [Amycolatopsis iheyensis]MCR6485695.1 hypothetical protein [Amycolatopsis iheyensis]